MKTQEIKAIFQLFIVSFIIFVQESIADFSRNILITDQIHFPCDASTINNILYVGSTVLENDGLTTISATSIGGWIMPRGFSNTFYTIFSFHESLSLSSSNTIFALAYSPLTSQIRLSLASNTPFFATMPNFTAPEWIFIQTYIQYDASEPSAFKLKCGTFIWNQRYEYYIKELSNSIDFQNPFLKATLELNIGHSHYKLTSITPSCSYAQYISVFSSKVFTNDVKTMTFNAATRSTKLLWHLDSLYTPINSGKIFSLDPIEGGHSVYSTNITPFSISTQSFQTDFILARGTNQGFTIQFSIKMDDINSLQNTRILTLGSNTLSVLNNLKLQLNSSYQTSVINNLSNWVHIVVFVFQSELYNSITVSVPSEPGINSLSITISPIRVTRLSFGGSSTSSFKISSVRIFTGVSFTESNSCYYMYPSNGVSSCLVCKPTYLLSTQNNYQCISSAGSTPDPTYPFETKWTPSQRVACPIAGMIHDKSTGTCRCRKQYFLSTANTCKECRRYCDGCTTSATVCKVKDPRRSSSFSGLCAALTFDDGYNCKDISQLLPNTPILSIPFPSPVFTPTNVLQESYQIFDSMNNNVNLAGSLSCLFTFSYQPYVVSDSSYSYSEQPIAVVTINSVEVITLYYKKVLLPSPSEEALTVNLRILGSLVWTTEIHQYNASWYAIWSNFASNTVLSILVNGNLITKSFTNAISQIPIVSSSICIGSCVSNYYMSGGSSSLSKGILNNAPFRFFTNSLSPTLFPLDSILDLLRIERTILCEFSYNLLDQQQTKPSIFLGKYIQTSTCLMDFLATYVDLTFPLRGFGMSSSSAQIHVTIDSMEQFDVPISLTMSVFIQRIYSLMSILSYKYTSEWVIEYFIIPFEQPRTASIRVCIGVECKETESVRLNLFASNFLAIFPMDQTPFSLEMLKLAFKVICNYSSETLTFMLPRPKSSDLRMQNLAMFVQTELIKSYVLQINRIQFFQGNTYVYEDKDPSSYCYASLNGFNNSSSSSNICMQPKLNYYLVEGGTKVISSTTCVQNSNTIRFVNESTRECIDSQQTKVSCFEIKQESLECLTCKPGFYKPSGSGSCFPCEGPCLTCVGTSINCLSCVDTYNQLLPSCECIEIGTYYDKSSLSCLTCASSCESCFETSKNCLTCSINRVNPPECLCDPRYFNQNKINPLNPCELLVCESQCQTCSSSPSNCETCASSSAVPPKCACKENSLQNPDGSCQTCPSGTYAQSSTRTCTPCESPCTECIESANKCLECESWLSLSDNTCICGYNHLAIQTNNGGSSNIITCAEETNMTFNLAIKQNAKYELVFTFAFQLQIIDFTSGSSVIQNILKLSLQDVPDYMFSLTNPTINANVFRVEITPLQSFSTTSGYVIFIQNLIFVSEDSKQVLAKKYLEDPFLIESIGPFFFTDTGVSPLDLEGLTKEIKESNQTTFLLVQSLQILFYVFNSLQPTVLFLLLKINFPPNLYSFLQTVGMTVFPDVEDYQLSANSSKNQSQNQNNHVAATYSFFELDDASKQVEKNRSKEVIIKRVGFSNSLLLSIPMICFKYMAILTLIFLAEFLKQLFTNIPEKFNLVLTFLRKQLVVEIEVNLFLSVLAILINLENINEESWTNRYGVYCAFMILAVNFHVIKQLYNECSLKELNSTSNISSRNNIIDSKNEKKQWVNASVVAYETGEQENNSMNPFQEFLTANLKQKRKLSSRKYFFFSLILKYFMIGVMYFFREFEDVICVICALCFFGSAMLTLRMKPFLSLRSRYVKILTDFGFSICWVMHLVIASIEKQLLTPTNPIDADLSEVYLKLGQSVVILLIISNLLYIVEQVYSLVDSFREFLRKRKSDSQDKQRFLPSTEVFANPSLMKSNGSLQQQKILNSEEQKEVFKICNQTAIKKLKVKAANKIKQSYHTN